MFNRNIYKAFFSLLFCLAFFLSSDVKISSADITGNVNVSLSVPVTENDYQFSFSSVGNVTEVNQDSVLYYQILYGAKPSITSPSQITLTANFADDIVSQGHILDYIPGSATNGYANTIPVIDLVNRTITWTISSLPSGAIDQIVTFKLKTNSNYTGSNKVNFRIRASMTNKQDQTISQNYSYLTVRPTLTPTPNPSAASSSITSTPGLTSFPTLSIPVSGNVPVAIVFKNISLEELTSRNITLSVETSVPVKLKVLYGTDISNLHKSATGLVYKNKQYFALENLLPKTTYYLKIIAADEKNQTKTSDVYMLTTAKESNLPQIILNSILITSGDVVLYNGGAGKNIPGIVIPKNTPYSFRFKLERSDEVKSVQALVRNKFVLGITSADETEPNMQNVTLVETSGGFFEGRLKSSFTAGSYELYAKIVDRNGNILEKLISDVLVSQPITVKNSKEAIESARILLYSQDFKTGKYIPLPSVVFPVKNPNYTDLYGQLAIALPRGNYMAKVTALGYSEKEILFTLSNYPPQGYPVVTLVKGEFSPLTIFTYYWTIMADSFNVSKLDIQSMSLSYRFFDLNAFLTLAFLIILTLLSFSERIHLPLRSFKGYFLFVLRRKKNGNKGLEIIKGKVVDRETGKGVPRAVVALTTGEDKEVAGVITTDENGNFQVSIDTSRNYLFGISGIGYEQEAFMQTKIQGDEYIFKINKRSHTNSFIREFKMLIQKIPALLFESLLILSFIFEISLGFVLGFNKAGIFIGLSLLNLILWLIHLSHLSNEKKIF